MFTYRKTTKKEDESWGLQCSNNMPNGMRCTRRIARVINNSEFSCEGHFQIRLHQAQGTKEEILNFDKGGEALSGKSEPTEK